MTNVSVPRPEYPRPQFERERWINLNGKWEYKTDRGMSGVERGFNKPDFDFDESIIVPFCRESELSGIGDKDFCQCAWYRRRIDIPSDWRDNGRRVILNVGACDYLSRVWVNGKYIGHHVGGYVAFSFDITDALKDGENYVTIQATDDVRSGNQPAGKQSAPYFSKGCSYTRTTGIWQTVWLECVEKYYITNTKYYPDIQRQKLVIEAYVSGGDGLCLGAVATFEGREVGRAAVTVHGRVVTLELPLSELHLWEVGCGRLYDLTLTYGDDIVKGYFGMRRVDCRDGIMYLNNKPVFQRLVLDQGFYPDGIYTASSLDALERDIDLSLAVGFNGARLHQKVFEPLFLSLCDKKGYIVWGEHANWVLDISRDSAFENFIPEWMEIMERDFNHPAIIGWCPLNETQKNQKESFVRLLASVTRAYDSTRLYIDTSGWLHIPGVGDIMDIHNYEQDPAKFTEQLAPLAEGKTYNVHSYLGDAYRLDTDATFVSEYGGTWWASKKEGSGWGYGKAPEDMEEFVNRFKGLTETLLFHPRMGGLCYTQLTDVDQETNGLYTYDRVAKFDPELFKEILSQKAAIEK